MAKILRQEVFSYFVDMLLVCCLHSYNNFLLYINFEMSLLSAMNLIVTGAKLSPVSLYQ